MAQHKENLLQAAELLGVEPGDLMDALETQKDLQAITYEVHCDDQHSRGTIHVPSYLTGDPKAAVGMYLFGYAGAAQFVTKAEVQ